METGRPEDAVTLLRPLFAEQPLREQSSCRLLTALDRSGARPEALTTYHKARGLLRESLGVEPGAELRRLHAELLRDDERADGSPTGKPRLNPPSRRWKLLASAATVLVIVILGALIVVTREDGGSSAQAAPAPPR